MSQRTRQGPSKKHPFLVGRWLPQDQSALNEYLARIIQQVDGKRRPEDDEKEDVLLPVIQDFKTEVEKTAELLMFFNLMFEEVPFTQDPAGKPQVKDYKQMFRILNAIMTQAPEFNKTDVVAIPITALLNWSMGTVNGYAAYLNDTVNKHFERVLNYWGAFLVTDKSCYVLVDDQPYGWFTKDALAAMPGFKRLYVCDPTLPHWGFGCWDDFFTRLFRPGIRPVHAPDDPTVIVNACESAPYKIQHNAQLRDEFWIKAQKYSLLFMLNDETQAKKFVGGTVYQAFLSALNYHRWHSPVDGTIVKVEIIPGTYYSETLSMGWDNMANVRSQGYIAEVATRCTIYIECDNPAIGLVCFLGIGMVEVSSCDITVCVGQTVKKGDQIGMFHFGGSSHCLIFRPGVDLDFDLRGQTPGLDAKNLHVKSLLATLVTPEAREPIEQATTSGSVKRVGDTTTYLPPHYR